jgi:hypothetical protein
MIVLIIKSFAIWYSYSISGIFHRLVVALTHQCTLVTVWVAAVTWELVVLDHIIEVCFFMLLLCSLVKCIGIR